MLLVLAALVSPLALVTVEAQVWSYAQFFTGSIETTDFYSVESTSVTAGDVNVSDVFVFSVAHPSGVAGVVESANLAAAAREFVEYTGIANRARTLTIYAVETAQVDVTEHAGGTDVTTSLTVSAGTVGTLSYTVLNGADIIADGDVVLHLRYGTDPAKQTLPVVRPAAVIFGVCSLACVVYTPGQVAGTIHQVCVDGTTADFAAQSNRFDAGLGFFYTAPVCRYEAPGGLTIAGHQHSDNTGDESAVFISSDEFQVRFALPLDAAFVVLMSDQPATCTYRAPGMSDTLLASLTGYTETPGSAGVYGIRIASIPSEGHLNVPVGTAFCCDFPVGAVADFDCAASAVGSCEGKETNILAMPSIPEAFCLPTTTTATTTDTATKTTITASNTTTSTVSTSTKTTITATSTTTTTRTTMTNTSTSTSTTTSNTTTVTTTATNTTTVTTSTATTFTLTTSSATTTTKTATTSTDTTATETVSTTTTTTSSSTTSTTSTATVTVTTSTETTLTATTATITTRTITTRTITTRTITTRTITTETNTITTNTISTSSSTMTTALNDTNGTDANTSAANDTNATLTSNMSSTTVSSNANTSTGTSTTNTTTTTSTTNTTSSSSSSSSSSSTSSSTSSGSSTTTNTTTNTITNTTTTSSMTFTVTTTTTTTTGTTSTNSSTTSGSSTTNSSSTTGSSSTTSMTTSTSSTLTSVSVVGTLFDVILGWEAKQLGNLGVSGEDSVSVSIFGIMTVAVSVTPADEETARPLGDAANALTLPDAFFADIGEQDGVITATSFGDEYLHRLSWPSDTWESEGGSPLGQDAFEPGLVSITVQAMIHVALVGKNVTSLVQPIEITMNVAKGEGLECAYWDASAGFWSGAGVTTKDVPMGAPMVCLTTHFTLFAVVLRDFPPQVCSQVALMRLEAIQGLAPGEWCGQVGSIVFWVLLGIFLPVLLMACVLDCRRVRSGAWSDENFLVASDEIEDNAGKDENWNNEPSPSNCCANCCQDCVAAKDALDEIVSKYFSHVSGARNKLKGLLKGLQCSGPDNVVRRLMASVVASSVQRQAAAEKCVSRDLASFVLDDKNLRGVLTEQKRERVSRISTGPRASFRNSMISSSGQPVWEGTDGTEIVGSESPNTTQWPSTSSPTERMGFWTVLYDSLTARAFYYNKVSRRCGSLPGAVCRLLYWQHPIGACLVRCVFRNSKVRTLLCLVYIMGAVMLGTVLYMSTDTVPDKRLHSASCGSKASVGLLIVLAFVSLLLSSIPALFLRSLSTRGIKKVGMENTPGWRKQLRVWIVQDRIIWVVGLCFLAFCLFFICLFLANTAPEDQVGWLTIVLISMGLVIVVIPIVLAVLLPLTAWLSLQLLGSSYQKTPTKELVIDDAPPVDDAVTEVTALPTLSLEVYAI